MKGIDIFLGIKSEQTLRDAVRAVVDEPKSEQRFLELCPVGQKDWIAGRRIGPSILFKDLFIKSDELVKELISLKSQQRIRHENIRLYAVRKPVPVFKDPLPDVLEDEPKSPARNTEGTVTCPVCGTMVHNYNIYRDPLGKMVGCYLCRGDKTHFKPPK